MLGGYAVATAGADVASKLEADRYAFLYAKVAQSKVVGWQVCATFDLVALERFGNVCW